MRIPFAVFRIAGAGLIIAAIVAQLILSTSVWEKTGVDQAFGITNFFSFFTIESNVFAAVVLLIGAGLAFAGRKDPTWFNVFRATTVTYMVTTGVVYNLLLRGYELPQGTTVPWSNEVLHVVGPILLLVDWLFAPGRREVATKAIWVIVSFPLVWGIYTLIRGPLTVIEGTRAAWYPYPFMNPGTSQNGYLSVAFYMILIALIIGAAGFGAIWLSRRKVLLESATTAA